MSVKKGKGGGRLFVVSAPSGTGKSTLVKRLIARLPTLVHSLSCTTRLPRPGEIPGKDYDFISPQEFQRRIDAGYFLEWARVHHSLYGTPKKPIDDALAAGRIILMDIDVQGGLAVKRAFPDAVTIFILPPSMEELEKRLVSRGTDDQQQVELRLANARRELSYQAQYEMRIINDDLETTLDALCDVVAGVKKI